MLGIPDAPKQLKLEAGRRCADRQTFRGESPCYKYELEILTGKCIGLLLVSGWSARAVQTLKTLSDMYPSDVTLLNELGVSNLMANRIEDARSAFLQASIRS